MMKFLKAVRQAYNKSEKGDYELKIKYDLDEPKKEQEEPEQEQEEPKKEQEEQEEQEEPEQEQEQEQEEPEQEQEEYSPDSPRYTEEGELIEPDDPDRPGKHINIKESKYITPHRKAFVNFINDVFYKQVLNETQDSDLNVYQNLVKKNIYV